MCGRWYVDMMCDDELTEYYSKLKNKNGIKTQGEVYPTDHIMVIANKKNLDIGVFNMKWGYQIGKNIVFNARVETINEKNVFIDGINNRRCVIPANCYYEWNKDTKEKNEVKDDNSNIMYFLGIYRFENNEPVCTIITKEASESMKTLHPRMPVMIKKNDIDNWLNIDCDTKTMINNSINDLIYNPVIEHIR